MASPSFSAAARLTIQPEPSGSEIVHKYAVGCFSTMRPVSGPVTSTWSRFTQSDRYGDSLAPRAMRSKENFTSSAVMVP